MSWPARVLQAEHSDVYASASYFTAEEACGFLQAALASGAVRRCGSLVVLCVSTFVRRITCPYCPVCKHALLPVRPLPLYKHRPPQALPDSLMSSSTYEALTVASRLSGGVPTAAGNRSGKIDVLHARRCRQPWKEYGGRRDVLMRKMG